MSARRNKPEMHRWGFYAAVMAVGLILSMLGNGLHTWSQWHTDVASGIDRGGMPRWIPTVAIAVVPVMVLVMTEMVVISYRRNTGWARSIVTALAALVGIVALVVSYVGLVHVFTVILGLPEFLGYVAPMIVDAPIIAATIGLWDVQQRIRADADIAPQPVDEAGRHRVESVDDRVVDSADDDRVQPSTTTAIDDTHGLVNSAVDSVADNVVADEPQVSAVDDGRWPDDGLVDEVIDNAVGNPDDSGRPLLSTTAHEPVDDSEDIVDDSEDEPSTTVDDRADEGVDDEPLAAIDNADDSAIDNTVDDDLARAVVDATRTKAGVDEVAEVLRLRRDGLAMAAIAEQVGIGSHSTVSGLVKAAVRLDGDYAAALGQPHDDRPRLAAVK